MPFTATPVRLATLRWDAGSGAVSALVRFPPGWARPTAVAYAFDEHFLLLSGELRMNGSTYRPGRWVTVPGGGTRYDSSAPCGAVALAWFTGDPGAVVRAEGSA
ncbi:hypothetical protein QI554_37655 [Yinghuangia seranimata]|nr:hypothetical protein [Yinghuangia seranimata]